MPGAQVALCGQGRLYMREMSLPVHNEDKMGKRLPNVKTWALRKNTWGARDDNLYGVSFLVVQQDMIQPINRSGTKSEKPSAPSLLETVAEVTAGAVVPSAGVGFGTGTGASVPAAAIFEVGGYRNIVGAKHMPHIHANNNSCLPRTAFP